MHFGPVEPVSYSLQTADGCVERGAVVDCVRDHTRVCVVELLWLVVVVCGWWWLCMLTGGCVCLCS